MKELENKILQLIRDLYEAEYIGGLEVTRTHHGYKLTLFLGTSVRMLVIQADVDNEEEFLEFLRKEFISRQLIKAKWFKGYVVYQTGDCRPHGQCCDRTRIR